LRQTSGANFRTIIYSAAHICTVTFRQQATDLNTIGAADECTKRRADNSGTDLQAQAVQANLQGDHCTPYTRQVLDPVPKE
jgi:hypothetical protein